MSIEDRDELMDLVAQAVIDKIEERDRIMGMVDTVARRVLQLQEEERTSRATKEQASTDVGKKISEAEPGP